MSAPDIIFHRGLFTTLDRSNPIASAVAIKDGLFVAVGHDNDVMTLAGPSTKVIDLKGRRVLPGLIDNHLHIIRGGLNFNMELRWDGVRSLADAHGHAEEAGRDHPAAAMGARGRRLHRTSVRREAAADHRRAQRRRARYARLHPASLRSRHPQRRCAARRRLHEENAGAAGRRDRARRERQSDRPAARQAERQHSLRDARQGAQAAVRIPGQFDPSFHARTEPARRDRRDRRRRRLPELSGGLRRHSEAIRRGAAHDPPRLQSLHPEAEGREGRLSELDEDLEIQAGHDYFRHNGAGEMLVFSAADFEDFRVPRPDMPPEMESELEDVVRILVQNSWPWRLHATYDETISRALDVFEKVNQDMPLDGLNWFFDHAETISDQSIDRIAALGGGIAVQHRMAYQGEYFVERYGFGAAEATPPVRKIIDKGVKISAGTDATRVASYNPWVSLAWLVTGMTVGRPAHHPQRNCLDRETALRMWTENVTWFSNEEGKKGRIEVGQLADLIVPDRDFFSCAESEIADIDQRSDGRRRTHRLWRGRLQGAR